jgi:hypothetical protein
MKSVSLQSAVAVLAFAISSRSAVTHAQTPPAATADDRLSSLTQTVARFENNLLSLAEALPADQFDFAPTKEIFKPGSAAEFATVRTFAQQLTHICAEPYRQFAPFGVSPDTKVDLQSLDSLSKKDDIIKALKDSIAYQNKVIASITPENAFIPAGPRNATRISALIATLSDDGDHYGQMVEYLRMNGIIPPATVSQMHRMSQAPPQK